MKHAVLPTGHTLSFPDETPDQHIDAAVQQHLGVQPPPDPMDQLPILMQQIQQAVGAVAQMATAIAQGQQQLMQAVGALTQVMGHVAGTSQQTAEIGMKGLQLHAAAADQHTAALRDMKSSFDKGHADMVKAVTAPKKIITDKAGKPVGTQTDMGDDDGR